MNTRIKELIKQHDVDIHIDGMGYGEGNIEGLVEIIIRECASVVKKEMDYDANWCDDKILKHFGVKIDS